MIIDESGRPRPIALWEPQYGDLITYNRFMSWWGYVIGYDASRGEVSVVRAANPQVLFSLSVQETEQRTTKMDLQKIRQKSGFATLQVRNGQPIWYLS